MTFVYGRDSEGEPFQIIHGSSYITFEHGRKVEKPGETVEADDWDEAEALIRRGLRRAPDKRNIHALYAALLPVVGDGEIAQWMAELADQNGLHPDELRGRDLKTAISIIVRRGVSR